MLIIPFDPFTPFIKGVEYANDQNQQDIKFEQERVMRDADLAAKQASNDLNASLAPFKVGAASRADALGMAAQPGKLADATGLSNAALATQRETEETEISRRDTAAIKARMGVEEATINFNAWNEGGRDLSAFKKANDTALAQITEGLRQAKAEAGMEQLPALQAMVKQRVETTTKVLANAIRSNDIKVIREAMLLDAQAKSMQSEVEAEVLKRAGDTAQRVATATGQIAGSAVAIMPSVVGDKAAIIATDTQAAQIASERNASTAAVYKATEEKTRQLVTAFTGGEVPGLGVVPAVLPQFNSLLAAPTAMPTDKTKQAAFFDSKATELDEGYQALQRVVGTQLPAGTITGGAEGLFFEPLDGPFIPLQQFLAQYKSVFNYTPYATPAAKGKSLEQGAADVALTQARTAKAKAEAAKAAAGTAKLSGTASAAAAVKAAGSGTTANSEGRSK